MAIHSLSLSAAQLPGKENAFSPSIQQAASPGTKVKPTLPEALLTVTVDELNATQGELFATKDELNAMNLELVATLMELTALKVDLFAKEMELRAQKQVYQVPQTGQQVCWDNVSENSTVPHSTISCEGTYQDGGRRAGLAPPSPELRFTDNGDGTVTDNFTTLIWLKAGDCFGETSWEEALESVANLRDAGRKFTRCGLADQSVAGEWRLPNVNEIMSLMDYGNTLPYLPEGHPFDLSGVQFWTSTTFALESEFSFEGRAFRKESNLRYGDNLIRFGDAYVANLGTGELSHIPKDGRGRGKVTHTHKAGVMAVRERYSPTDRRNQIYQPAPEVSSNNKRER